MTLLKLTQIPHLNTIVIKQEGGHFFIAAPDSIVIDRDGLLRLVSELISIGFLHIDDIVTLVDNYYVGEEEELNEE